MEKKKKKKGRNNTRESEIPEWIRALVFRFGVIPFNIKGLLRIVISKMEPNFNEATEKVGFAMKHDEAEFKKWFRSHYDWSMTIEPALGTGDGMPDVCIIENRLLQPIELKIGEFETSKRGLVKLFPKRIRPAQIKWHHDYSKQGGKSLFIVGVWVECVGWQPWVIPSNPFQKISRWKQGYLPEHCTPWLFP